MKKQTNGCSFSSFHHSRTHIVYELILAKEVSDLRFCVFCAFFSTSVYLCTCVSLVISDLFIFGYTWKIPVYFHICLLMIHLLEMNKYIPGKTALTYHANIQYMIGSIARAINTVEKYRFNAENGDYSIIPTIIKNICLF